MARFRYEFPWNGDLEKLEFTHSDRQHFKHLRSTEELGNVSLQERGSSGGRRESSQSPTESEVSSRPSMETEMSVHEDYWPYDSHKKLDEAIADAKSYWISQGKNPQAYTDEQWGQFLKKKLKETKQLRARE